jgi:hypothetical protein
MLSTVYYDVFEECEWNLVLFAINLKLNLRMNDKNLAWDYFMKNFEWIWFFFNFLFYFEIFVFYRNTTKMNHE